MCLLQYKLILRMQLTIQYGKNSRYTMQELYIKTQLFLPSFQCDLACTLNNEFTRAINYVQIQEDKLNSKHFVTHRMAIKSLIGNCYVNDIHALNFIMVKCLVIKCLVMAHLKSSIFEKHQLF